MSASFYKNGIVHGDDLYESDAMNDVVLGGGSISYTPSTGTNSCINTAYKWFYPEDTVAGDVFRVYATVVWSGFDESNTSGTFNIHWQGANFTDETTAVWKGTNFITTALNAKQNFKTLVLSSTSGVYTYETTFTMQQDFMDSYIGSYIGIRSDYSNGTGKISTKDVKVIPDKYSVSDASSIRMRIGDEYIVVQDFIEY